MTDQTAPKLYSPLTPIVLLDLQTMDMIMDMITLLTDMTKDSENFKNFDHLWTRSSLYGCTCIGDLKFFMT